MSTSTTWTCAGVGTTNSAGSRRASRKWAAMTVFPVGSRREDDLV
jgi:hypothetical protein